MPVRNGFGGWSPYCLRTLLSVRLKGSMEAGIVKPGTEPDDLEVREFARRKVWAMTDPGTAERWDEDIASDVLIEYMQALDRPDLEIRNWRGWIGAAVRSRLYAERRREQLRLSVHEKYALGAERSRSDPEPIEIAESHEAITELDEAMRTLRSHKQKQILALAYFKGMTSGEIGQLLGMSPESVRGCKMRAIEKLRVAHHDRGFDEALMGVEIGVAATLALLQRPGPLGWMSSTVSHVSDVVQGALVTAKQTIGRIGGSAGGQTGDASAGVAGGAGGAAGTAAAIGGGKLVGMVCAGVGSVCVAGALVAGGGSGVTEHHGDATKPVSEARIDAAPAPAAAPAYASATAGDKAGGQAPTGRRQAHRNRSAMTAPNSSTSDRASSPAASASPSQAAEAFGPPVGGSQPSGGSSSGGSSSGGSSSSASGQSSSQGSAASAGEAASAFGALP